MLLTHPDHKMSPFRHLVLKRLNISSHYLHVSKECYFIHICIISIIFCIKRFISFTFTFTFMHLADAFIQSDLQCIIHGYTFFYQYVCSLGIEPTTFALLTQCSTTEPQEHLCEDSNVIDIRLIFCLKAMI